MNEVYHAHYGQTKRTAAFVKAWRDSIRVILLLELSVSQQISHL